MLKVNLSAKLVLFGVSTMDNDIEKLMDLFDTFKNLIWLKSSGHSEKDQFKNIFCFEIAYCYSWKIPFMLKFIYKFKIYKM